MNAWLREVNAGARGRGAPEFWIFPPQIAPWQPADSLAIAKLMALQITDAASTEVLRARVSLVLGDERVEDLLPDVPGPGIAALPEYAGLFPEGLFDGAPRYAGAMPPDPLNPVRRRGLAGASNAWAAAPSRSATGGTLLANDPHLGFSAPGYWYLARLELETGGVIGATIPGLPAIIIGRSADLAWGLTSTYLDDQDVFIERVNPDNPEEVQTPEGWKALRTRPSIIQIEGETPRTITLRWSDNGPILPSHQFDLGAVTPPGHVAALGWTALSPNDTSIGAALGIMRAKSVEEAVAAGELHVAPAQNLTLIDRETVALKVIGKLPRRSIRNQSGGRLPVPGWRAENRWDGAFRYAGNPGFMEPEGGIVGNTNNKVIDRPYPFHLSFDWGDTQRVQRWRRLMQSREVHTRDSFIEAQLDSVSFTARALLALRGPRSVLFRGYRARRDAGTPAPARACASGRLEW